MTTLLTAIEAGIEDYWNQTSLTLGENVVPEMMEFIRLRLERKEDSAMTNLANQIPAGRCEALVSYGDAWTAGRKRCSNRAVIGLAFCGVHLKQKARRAEREKTNDK